MLVLLFFLLNRKINSLVFDKGTIDGISIVHQKKFAANYDSTLFLLIRNLSVDQELKLRHEIFGDVRENSTKFFVNNKFIFRKIKGYDLTRV